MIEFDLEVKKLIRHPHINIVQDGVLTIRIEEKRNAIRTHEVSFIDGGEVVEMANIFVRIPSVITRESFLSMWLYLLLDRSGENSDLRLNTRRLVGGGRVVTPPNLGYPSLMIVTKDRRQEWCLTSDYLVWPERMDDKLPMFRKNGVRIVETLWPVKDVWTNFGITQDQLCIELWGHDKQRLACYFCPFTDHLTRDQVQRLHLDVPLGGDLSNHLVGEWDEREKFRLEVTDFGPLLFMRSVDGELKAIASEHTFTPKALHVVKIVHDRLVRTSPDLARYFRDATGKILFSDNIGEVEVEQQLLKLSFYAVEEFSKE